MKRMLSKLWRSGTALLLVMSLAFSNCGVAFAQGSEDTTPKKYVSLGDSMVNGYGLDGYEYVYHDADSNGIWDAEKDEECHANEYLGSCSNPDATHIVFEWSNGYMQETAESYPALLAEKFGWDLTQLAMSAMRVEDLHWLLELDYTDSEALGVATMPEWNEESWNATFTNGDRFTWDEFATSRLNKVYPGSSVESVAENYQYSVADADVISLGIGNGNFGVFMLGRIMEAIGFSGTPDETMVYNVESAIRNLDADFQAEILSMIDALCAEAEAMGITIDDGDDETTSMMEGLMNTVSYVMVSYVINYRGVIDAIVELNPDAEIIIVGLMNTMDGMKFNINGEIVDMGELMGATLGIVSAYMAGLPTVLQAADEYAEATFYYAEAANVDVMVNNYAAEIKNGNVTVRDRFITEIVGECACSFDDKWHCDEYGCNCSNDATVCYRTDGMVWDLLIDMTKATSTTEDDNYVYITRDEIETYDELAPIVTDEAGTVTGGKVCYAALNHKKAQSIATYLAFEKAVIAASDPDDGKEPILSLESIMNLGNLGSIFEGVFEAYELNVEKEIATDPELTSLKSVNESAATLLVTPDALSDALVADETVFGLLNLFARCLIGTGLGAHPSAAGHAELYEAIKTAYENGYTAQDETIANATKLVEAIAAYIAENYEEIYAAAYAEAKNAGYIDAATAAIDDVIADLTSIDLSESEMTDAFKAEVAGEIEEIVETLVAAQALIVEADLLDQASLDALMAMLDEAGEATANLLNLLNQAGVDVTELVIIPALEEAKAKLVNEVIPAVKAAAAELAADVYDYLVEVLADTYDELVDLLVEAAKEYLPEVADAIYDYLYNNPEEVIAFVSEYGPYVVEALEEYGDEVLAVLGYVLYTYGEDIAVFVIENHETILAALVEWAEVHGENTILLIQVYAEALGLCDAVREQIAELEAALEELEAEVEAKIAELEAELEALKAELEAAADELKAEIEAKIAEVEAEIEALKAEIAAKIAEVEAAVEALKAAVEDAIEDGLTDLEAVKDAAEALAGEVADLIEAVKDAALDAVNEAIAEVKAAAEALDEALSNLLGDVYDDLKDLGNDALNAVVEAIVDAVKEYAPEIADAIYDYLYNNPDEVIDFVKTYGPALLDILEEYGDEALAVVGYILYTYGEDLAALIIENADEIMEGLMNWLEVHGENTAELLQVYAEALGLCDAVREQIAELEALVEDLKAQLENASEELKAAIEEKIAEIEAAIEELKAQIEALEEAIVQAIADAKAAVDAVVEEIKETIEEIKAEVEELKAEVEAAVEELMAEIEEKIAEIEALIDEIVATIEQMIYDATHGEYAVTPDSFYVALGDGSAVSPSYADLLAGKLCLTDRYANLAQNGLSVMDTFAVIAENAELIAKADLVTIGYSNNTLVSYMVDQMYKAMMGVAVDELDWSVYVGEEGVPYVEQALAEVYAELLAQGLEADMAAAMMVGIESYAYAYVNHMTAYPELVNAIHEISPEALVVIVGMYNALDNVVLDVDGSEVAIGEYVQYLIDAANLESLIYAMLTDNTVYVHAPEVETVADATGSTAASNLTAFILSMLYTGGVELYPSEAGHDYIYRQILNALDIKAAYLLGDVNLDGVVNSADTNLLYRYTTKDTSLGDLCRIQMLVADVNQDGVVNSADTNLLYRYTTKDATLAWVPTEIVA